MAIMKFKKLETSIPEQRENEQLRAQVEEQEALLEYVMIMTDVEIPEESEGDINEY